MKIKILAPENLPQLLASAQGILFMGFTADFWFV